MKKFTIKLSNGCSIQTNNVNVEDPTLKMILKINKTEIVEIIKNF